MGYWIKVYTDILDDPKYYKLSEKAKLGMYELMLVAKKLENGKLTGELPSIDEIAFHTRKSIEFWREAMKELIEVGIIVEKQPGYLIKNYVKRQQAIPPDERMRQWRKKTNDQRMDDDESIQLTHCSDDDTERSVNETFRNGEKRREEKEKSRERDREEVEKSTKNDDDNRLTELLLSTFAGETGITTTNQSDMDALKRLVTAKASKNDLIGGIQYMRENNYPIVGIKSILNPTIVEMSKRTVKKRGPDDEDYKKYTKGKYADHIKS